MYEPEERHARKSPAMRDIAFLLSQFPRDKCRLLAIGCSAFYLVVLERRRTSRRGPFFANQ